MSSWVQILWRSLLPAGSSSPSSPQDHRGGIPLPFLCPQERKWLSFGVLSLGNTGPSYFLIAFCPSWCLQMYLTGSQKLFSWMYQHPCQQSWVGPPFQLLPPVTGTCSLKSLNSPEEAPFTATFCSQTLSDFSITVLPFVWGWPASPPGLILLYESWRGLSELINLSGGGKAVPLLYSFKTETFFFYWVFA